MTRSHGLSTVLSAVLICLSSCVVFAQQSVHETSRLPGQFFYSNQLSACDFDRDGDTPPCR